MSSIAPNRRNVTLQRRCKHCALGGLPEHRRSAAEQPQITADK